ncbi:MAG: hypothetical protein JOZ54_08450 [Acidobacteria bacterium]|nr:hypothetical protein [Acidobacteriota bacterium]
MTGKISEAAYDQLLMDEQLAVVRGQMTTNQYFERLHARFMGATVGATLVAAGYGLAELGSVGYGTYQAWRAATAAAATVKLIEQTSKNDGKIFQTAMNMARNGANTFMNNL